MTKPLIQVYEYHEYGEGTDFEIFINGVPIDSDRILENENTIANSFRHLGYEVEEIDYNKALDIFANRKLK